MTAQSLQITPITTDSWSLFARLLGPTGVAGGCWCAYFIMTANQFNTSTPRQHKTHARQRVADGMPFGLVAHLDDDPQAWVAVSPRACNPRLERSVVARTEAGQDLGSTWSVTCFYSRPEARRQGISRMLLDAAVEHARRGGATTIEGYPVDTDIGSVSPDEQYHGRLETFLARGFELVARRGKRRALVRLDLRPSTESDSEESPA